VPESRTTDEHRTLARRLITVVVALTVIAPFSIDTFLPSLPTIAREFGASEFYLQQTLSLYLIGFAAMTLVYGPLSDAFGRRRVVLISLTGYIASAIACALAPSAHALVLARIAQGVAAAGGLVVGRAVVRDSFTGAMAQRVMSQVMLIFALAPAIAPIIGGWLHDVFGWRAVFWFMAALGAAVWMWAAMRLPETLSMSERHPGHPRAIAAAYWHALRIPAFMLLIAAIAFNFSGVFLYISGSPALLYRELGLGAQDFWQLFIPVVAGLMGGAYISGRMAGRYSHEQAVVVAYWIMLSAAAFNIVLNAMLPSSAFTVIGPIALYACGMSLGTPNLSLLAFDLLPRNRGLASALQNFTQTTLSGIVAGLLVPIVAGHVLQFASGTMSLCAIGFASWLLSRRLSS
jgi:DHA1 family bicyclomycin/chloramphenicol resistance-like MFS transporter